MKRWKRSGAVLGILLLLLSLLPLTGTAAETESARVIQPDFYVGADDGDDSVLSLREKIYAGLMACEETIDVSAFGVHGTDVSAAIQHLRNGCPELFHVGLKNEYCFDSVTGVVRSLKPDYTLTGDALEAARASYSLWLSEIAEEVEEGWSDFEICLFLHDAICDRFAYDNTHSVFDVYNFFKERSGVCQAYTLTYIALLEHFSIPVTYAVSNGEGSMNHIWNLVTLAGKSYHVDVTWDDALQSDSDFFGRAKHNQFLCSDKAISDTGHYGWTSDTGIVCDSTLYDDSPLDTFNHSFAFCEGKIYGVENGVIYRLDPVTFRTDVVYTISSKWSPYGESLRYYTNKYSGLASWGGLLYFNTGTTVWSMAPDARIPVDVFSVSDAVIFELLREGDHLIYLTAKNAERENAEMRTWQLPTLIPPCSGAHQWEIFATIPATCQETGIVCRRCTVCGATDTEIIQKKEHRYREEVIPPSFGQEGYTLYTCEDCGTTVKDHFTDALPMPTISGYSAEIDAVAAAVTPEDYLNAVRTARAMEPHLTEALAGDVGKNEKARLDKLIADYDKRAVEIDQDSWSVVSVLLNAQCGWIAMISLMTGLLLVLRRVMGVQ